MNNAFKNTRDVSVNLKGNRRETANLKDPLNHAKGKRKTIK